MAIKEAEQLTAYVWNDTKSIRLMDRFEGIGEENDTVYKKLVLSNRCFGTTKEGSTFNYRLVVERRKPGASSAGDLTFTEFKQGYTGELKRHINHSVCKQDVAEYAGKNKVFYLQEPFRLRAQNSRNRMGYGWTWDWSGGYGKYTEGTFYGETTEYVFAGIYID